jgi:hypothetical protein
LPRLPPPTRCSTGRIYSKSNCARLIADYS